MQKSQFQKPGVEVNVINCTQEEELIIGGLHLSNALIQPDTFKSNVIDESASLAALRALVAWRRRRSNLGGETFFFVCKLIFIALTKTTLEDVRGGGR